MHRRKAPRGMPRIVREIGKSLVLKYPKEDQKPVRTVIPSGRKYAKDLSGVESTNPNAPLALFQIQPSKRVQRMYSAWPIKVKKPVFFGTRNKQVSRPTERFTVLKHEPGKSLFDLTFPGKSQKKKARKFLFKNRNKIVREFANYLADEWIYGITHGRLHPGNVIIDKKGHLKVIDWEEGRRFKNPNDFASAFKADYNRVKIDLAWVMPAIFDILPKNRADRTDFGKWQVNAAKNALEFSSLLDEEFEKALEKRVGVPLSEITRKKK